MVLLWGRHWIIDVDQFASFKIDDKSPYTRLCVIGHLRDSVMSISIASNSSEPHARGSSCKIHIRTIPHHPPDKVFFSITNSMTEFKQQKMNASSTPKRIGETLIQRESVVVAIAATAVAHMLIRESDSDQKAAAASLRSLAACGSEVKYEVMYNQRDLKAL